MLWLELRRLYRHSWHSFKNDGNLAGARPNQRRRPSDRDGEHDTPSRHHYGNRYISVFAIKDRKVTEWRDYLDPLRVFDALEGRCLEPDAAQPSGEQSGS